MKLPASDLFLIGPEETGWLESDTSTLQLGLKQRVMAYFYVAPGTTLGKGGGWLTEK